MTKEQILTAISSLKPDDLSTILFGSNSVEDDITDLIKARLEDSHPNMNLISRRTAPNSRLMPDLINYAAKPSPVALEAKHYSSGQPNQFFMHVQGPILDSQKLKGLEHETHFILQYTSELVELSGNIIKIPKQILKKENGVLHYFYNENGFVASKIPAKPVGKYSQILASIFSKVFNDSVVPITIKVTKHFDDGSFAAFNEHFFLMEVKWSAELKKRYDHILKARNVEDFKQNAD